MRFEADAEVQVAGCRVLRFERDRDALSTSLDELIDSRSEDVAGNTSLLMMVECAHWFHHARRCHRVVPEHSVGSRVAIVVHDDKIQVGTIERCL